MRPEEAWQIGQADARKFGLNKWANPTVEEVVDNLLHSLVNDARDVRALAGTERYTDYLRESIPQIEEAFDQLRAALDVLNRGDA